jgi:hypothetical protein
MPPTDPSANGGEHEVFGALPRTRPQRRSAKRDRPAQSAPRPARKPATAAPAKATASPARAKIGADAKRPRKATAPPVVPAAGYATPTEARKASHGNVLSTAVHAGGELVEIAATVAGQAMKSMLGRLPRV